MSTFVQNQQELEAEILRRMEAIPEIRSFINHEDDRVKTRTTLALNIASRDWLKDHAFGDEFIPPDDFGDWAFRVLDEVLQMDFDDIRSWEFDSYGCCSEADRKPSRVTHYGSDIGFGDERLVVSVDGDRELVIEANRDQWGTYLTFSMGRNRFTVAQEDETRSFLDAMIAGLTALKGVTDIETKPPTEIVAPPILVTYIDEQTKEKIGVEHCPLVGSIRPHWSTKIADVVYDCKAISWSGDRRELTAFVTKSKPPVKT